jgi:hypothetical protein
MGSGHFECFQVSVRNIKKAICDRLLNNHKQKQRISQMTYHHLTIRELTLIADFWHQGTKAY